jgi:Flp pilus assembly pilin Flp
MYWYLALRNWLKSEEGQDVTEYVLLIAFVAIVLVAAAAFFTDGFATWFEAMGQSVADYNVGPD